jgi:hypothetical protein
MKVIADMYFDQIAYPDEIRTNENYTGAQVNTFQVRTFELYNKDKEGTLRRAIAWRDCGRIPKLGQLPTRYNGTGW